MRLARSLLETAAELALIAADALLDRVGPKAVERELRTEWPDLIVIRQHPTSRRYDDYLD